MTAGAGGIRIGNCSGFYGDRVAAMHEMLTGGDLDEALATLIDDPERADAASLFDRVDAFKRGFFLEGGSGTAASVEFCS